MPDAEVEAPKPKNSDSSCPKLVSIKIAKFMKKMMIFGHFLLILYFPRPRRDARSLKNCRNTSKI